MAIPLVPIAIAALAGGSVGFIAGNGAEAVKDGIKYAAIGAGIYLIIKKYRVLR